VEPHFVLNHIDHRKNNQIISMFSLKTLSVTIHLSSYGWYQIVLLGDRGTRVLTTCPKSL